MKLLKRKNIYKGYCFDLFEDQVVWVNGKQLDRTILVTDWLGGNANGTTGDFSLGVAGWLIENGKRTKSITEMNISGNYNDLLMNLIEVGNDPWIHSSFRTPTMVFDKVSFSGS